MARRQLLELGLTSKVIQGWLAAGRLIPLHRGVYAVGHARLTREGEWLAAVLATGRGAVLSHRSAAALHRLLPERGRRIDVSTSARRRSSTWIEVRGQVTLAPADVTNIRGVPVTTIARTLVDLAALVDPAALVDLPDIASGEGGGAPVGGGAGLRGGARRRDLTRAVNEADVLGLLDRGAIEEALRRTRGRRASGAVALRETLARHDAPRVLRSELERRFAALLVAHALPPARHNVRVEGWEVDAAWPMSRVAVELDGWRYHRTPAAFARDRRKEQALRAAGWEVRRLTWADVTERAAATASGLRDALTAG